MSNTQLFANNASSNLASPITSQSTQLTISSATNFPVAVSGVSFFALTISNATNTVYEIVYVTNRQGTLLTVNRGQEGTTPLAWPTGSIVYASFTAQTFQSFLQGPNVAQGLFTQAPSGQTAYTYNTYNSPALEAFCVPKGGPGSLYKFRGQIFGSIPANALILGIDSHTIPVNGAVVPDLVYEPDATTGAFEDRGLVGNFPWPFNGGINFFLSTTSPTNPYVLTIGSAVVRFEAGFV